MYSALWLLRDVLNGKYNQNVFVESIYFDTLASINRVIQRLIEMYGESLTNQVQLPEVSDLVNGSNNDFAKKY